MTEAWDNTTRPVLSMNMDGSRACLDLLNTLVPAVPVPVQSSAETDRDLLQTYPDLIALAIRTAVLPAVEADSLLAIAAKNPVFTLPFLDSAKNFRNLFRRLLMKTSQGAAPPTRDLALFEELRARARSFEVLVWEDGRYRLRSRYQAEGLSSPLNAFIRDADDLLRSPDLRRVRVVRINSPEARFVLG